MEHDIPFGNSNRENGTTFLDFPLFLGIFQWDEPTKRVPFTASPEIPEILTKWKAPKISHNSRRRDFLCLFTSIFSSNPSSETQGQIVGTRESLYGREEPLGTMSYQTSSNGRRRSGF